MEGSMSTPMPVATRRTRAPDRFTDLVLVVSAVFGVWAVALTVLTFIGITQAGFFYSDPKAAIKAAGATVVVVLVLTQLYTMESVMGHLPRRGIRMRVLMRAHRWSGRIAILLAALIAYFCITDIGAPRDPVRSFIHASFGASAFAALGIKFALIRFRPELAYRAAPWIGRYVVLAFVIVWLTSSYAYFTHQL
jgi:hypothetical protein